MTLSEFDLYLMGTGRHRRAYDHLGAHPAGDGSGVHFAVWAPNAEAVSVVGDFNAWSPAATPLQPAGESGIWHGDVAAVGPGTVYKYAVKPRGRKRWLEKSDPYAFAAEMRPNTASVVADLATYSWRDSEWIDSKLKTQDSRLDQPISIYEVHLGSWRRDASDSERFLTYRELADTLPAYAADMGFTHLEFLPVAEHPLDKSWGYQVTGYFAPSARFGSPQDFMLLVDRCHQAGLGVILDWVPAHFPKDAHGLARFDGTHLYEHADPRRGEHPDWGTLIFNYGRNEVRSFLVSNALFWLDLYHVDGFRIDAVASMLYLDYSRGPGQWLPNRYGGRENLEAIDFLRELNAVVHEEYPSAITVAEESTAWPRVTGSVEEGGLGFDFKWNMGWMHDTLAYLEENPINRKYHHNQLTFSLMYAFSERFILPLSHDEVVHLKRSLLDKMPGDQWQKFANLRLLFGYMWGHPGKKLLFMGGEFGQWTEWQEFRSLDWHLTELDGEEGELHRGVQLLVSDLNRLLRSSGAMHEIDSNWAGFQWIDFVDSDNSIIAFQRIGRESSTPLIFVCNFTPVVRYGYRLGLPRPGTYSEILNTDAENYGGSGVGNLGAVRTDDQPWHGHPCSAPFTLPPLSCVVFGRDNADSGDDA